MTDKKTTEKKAPTTEEAEAEARVNAKVAEMNAKDAEARARGENPDAPKGKATKAKKAETAPPAASTTPAKAGKKSAASPSVASEENDLLAGYAKAFQFWEPVPAEEGAVKVNPAELVSIFDVRSNVKPITTFLRDTAGGIDTPIDVSLMRYIGETMTGSFSPDPKRSVKLVKNTVYKVITYGRRRAWASLEHGFKELDSTLSNYSTWEKKVHAAFRENKGREQMDQWDDAIHVKNLKDGGLTNEAISKETTIGSGTVSHLLGVFDVAAPVRKHFRMGSIGTTTIRQLRPLEDEDLQTKLCDMAVEKGWTEKELDAHIAAALAKGAGTKRKSKGDKKEVKLSVDYATVTLKAAPVAEVRPKLEAAETSWLQLKQKKAAPEKIGFAKGRLAGLREAFGLD